MSTTKQQPLLHDPDGRLTETQQRAWGEAIERLHQAGAYEVHYPSHCWYVEISDTAHINARFIDGEVFAQIMIDHYGRTTTSFATLDWVHADSNEECDCPVCDVDDEARA